MICPRCGKELEDSSSPFSDGGDFYSCKCGVEGYGYHEADGGVPCIVYNTLFREH